MGPRRVRSAWRCRSPSAAGATDELIELVAHLHATRLGGFDGRFHRVRSGVLAPRPSAPIPLLVGGKSAAPRPSARPASATWQAYNVTPDEFRALHARLREFTSGRTVSAGTLINARPDTDWAAELDAWRAAGAEHLAIHPGPLATAAERLPAAVR